MRWVLCVSQPCCVPPRFLQVAIYSMHRNKTHWRNPDQFKPDRWLPPSIELGEGDPPAFMPFGGGPHKCIGYQFANAEGVLTMIKLYQRVRWMPRLRGRKKSRRTHSPHPLPSPVCVPQVTFRLTPGQIPMKVKMILTLGPEHGVRVVPHERL